MKKNYPRIATYLLLVVATLFIISCTSSVPASTYTPNIQGLETTQELRKFSDFQEVRMFLENASLASSYTSYSGERGGTMMDAMVRNTAAPAAEGGKAIAYDQSSSPSSSGTDYSSTNVQYAGVDEADFVKTDGNYIYIAQGKTLTIIDATSPERPRQVAAITLPQRQSEYNNDYYGYYGSNQKRDMVVHDDTLAVIMTFSVQERYFPPFNVMPQVRYATHTNVLLYDISDRSKPRLSEQISVTGNYYQSRMIDGVFYVITQDGTYDVRLLAEPAVTTASGRIMPEIYYFDNPEHDYQFNTIVSIDLARNQVIDTKTFMLGYANTLMVSEDALYIAYQKQRYWLWSRSSYQESEKERFYNAVLPALEGELKTRINAALNSDGSDAERWSAVSEILAEYYAKAETDSAVRNQLERIALALEEYDIKESLKDATTTIHKITIDNGRISYAAKGQVTGTLLNQFSLDEHEGYLRVATTLTLWTSRMIQENNVFILDDSLNIVGELTGIAEDEQIYATRFMGDKLYMVTFRQVDPLFVIDVSDPTNPRIEGKLKIPGFSSYLHPYDDHMLIGVGRDADEDGRIKGIKVSLFDVRDVARPIEVDTITIGKEGSDTPVLYDHKAFLLDQNRGFIVLPVNELLDSDIRYGSYRSWHGAYVLTVSPQGLSKKGTIEHDVLSSSYGWWQPSSVSRSLYIGSTLFTISDKYVKANAVETLEELTTLGLTYEDPQYGQYKETYPMGTTGGFPGEVAVTSPPPLN